MNAPEVSVIIPAYNAGRWIGDAIRSVQAQTLADWEMIVVDDGSDDDTAAVVNSFADPRIRLARQPNSGVSTARNAGLERARGRYISILDADDAMEPENLALRVAAIKEHGVDWVFSDLAVCNGDLQPAGEVIVGADDGLLERILLGIRPGMPGLGSNLLADRKCFESDVRFDPQLSNAADQDMAIQLAMRFRYHRVPLPLIRYRTTPGSMSRNVALFQHDHLRMFRKARENGLLDDRRFRNTCMAKVYWAIGGSWWLLAHRRVKAVPWFLKAFFTWPAIVLRPLRKRLSRSYRAQGSSDPGP
jgi:glycosyltransferase involved in cell wall biosynthesis